jgi:serine/threonine protein kinase
MRLIYLLDSIFFSIHIISDMNKYNKLKLLGKGSYGTVYKVEKKKNNKFYALKQIRSHKLQNTYEIKNLINELKILCFHNCDYLLKCREIFYDNHQINIVTDYAKYSDLSNYILKFKNTNKLINEKIIWLIFIQCCYGIEYLHEYNIIHRDLKPANILLNDQSSILLADFGISKIIENKMNSFTLIGTPYYISPEMYKDINYDKKIDIWSIGCILYELTTLTVPFQASNMVGLKKKVISGYYYDKISNVYSKDIQNMIRFLLNIDVNRRPNIKEILSSRIFQKKEHEFNISNKNNFDKKINDKLHNQYSPPKITSKWNLLIDDIDKYNDNKSPKFINHKYDFKEYNDIDNDYDNINYELPPINNNIKKYKEPLTHINKNKNNELPKINYVNKEIEKPKYHSINNYYKKNKIKSVKNYIDRPTSPNKLIHNYDYPKLPNINFNYEYYKNKKYNDKFNKPSSNYHNPYYPKISEYNSHYYKNKYRQNYNIINNSKY